VTVSDYYAIHNAHHNDWTASALVILGVTLAVGVVGCFVQKVQPAPSRRDLLADFAMMVFIKFGLLGVLLVAKQELARWMAGPGASTPDGEAGLLGGLAFEPLASAWPLPPLAALALYVVVRDLGQWLRHVAMHKLPILWSFHKVHHANTSLSIFADYRLHLVEVALGSLVTLFTLMLTGYPVEYAFIAISLEESVGMFNHSNLRLHYGRVLSRIVTSPQNHRVHHSRERTHLDATGDAHNFAVLFPVWDIIAGSYYARIDDFPAATGVEGEESLERGGLVSRQWIGLRDAGLEVLALLQRRGRGASSEIATSPPCSILAPSNESGPGGPGRSSDVGHG
jgi:sterol desaturase/sphingolipid hydroxylase (fatty acid hydroxylase superfamily)